MKKLTLYFFFACAFWLALDKDALAGACASVAAGGNWSAAGTWGAGCTVTPPGATDQVTITAASTVVLDTSPTIAQLTINGTLNIGNSAVVRTLTVANGGAGNVTIAATGTMQVATAATHLLVLDGNLANNGILKFAPSATNLCNVTFNGNGSRTLSGTGATSSFNKITLNMGATNANVLNATISNFVAPAGFLTITNGTYKHNNTASITPWLADPAIPASGGFWLAASATVTTTAINVTTSGLFEIDAGTMNIGATDGITLNLGNNSTFVLNGGTLTVTGGIVATAITNAGAFTVNGGVINIQTIDAGPTESLQLGSASTFTMTGGTINSLNGNNTTSDIDIRSSTQTVTGGTVQMGPATGSTNPFWITNSNTGTVNLWNLVVNSSNSTNGIAVGPTLNVLNTLTISTGDYLYVNGATCGCGTGNLFIGGGNQGGGFINNGTFTAGSQNVSFVGTGASTMTIGGTVATSFYNLIINGSAGVTIAAATPSATVTNQLTLTTGNITTGGASACGIATPLILGASATLTGGGASSYVIGALEKIYNAATVLSAFSTAVDTFPIGTAGAYSPIDITSGTTSAAGNLVVCATATADPNMTVANNGGIDPNNDVNRYWSLTDTTLNVSAAPVAATFKFLATDLTGTATPANFIIERWNGSLWDSTTLVADNALSTAASNTALTAGTNQFAIGDPLLGFSGSVGAFNAFESAPYTPAGSVLGRLYTKLYNTSFSIDLVAISTATNSINAAYNSNPVRIDLLDARDNSGALTISTNCRSSWTTVIATQTLSPTWSSGRTTITIPAYANAARVVRVRVSFPASGSATLQGCSTDAFSIRPQTFSSLTSSASNNNSSGSPAIATSATFSFTVATGLTGYDNGSGATLASPQIVPAINNSLVIGSPNAGTIGGVFNFASSGTATGSGFFYSNVGNIGLQANAIFDSVFTAIDQSGDCVSSNFSNSLSGGMYGCNFGTAAVPQTTGTSGFGRFIPDNFGISVNSPTFGAACGSGGFTYVGQSFVYTTQPAFTVTARNGTNNGFSNATTTNYAGAYMKLSNAAGTSLNQGTYSTQSGRYSRYDALGGGTTPALNISNLPPTTSDPTIGTFTNGVGTLTFGSGTGLSFTRSTTTPSAQFSADIALALNIIDGDNVAYAGNPASFGSASAGGGIAFSSGKTMDYGRLQLQNANGSQLISMPIPIQTQYWNGTAFVVNSADNCTTITANNIAIGNPQNGLTAAAVSPPTVGGAFSAGLGSLRLPKPSTGNGGSVDVAVNLTNTTTSASCTAGLTSTAGANMTYLQGAWCGTSYVNDPTARATFGTYTNTNQFIYQRENY